MSRLMVNVNSDGSGCFMCGFIDKDANVDIDKAIVRCGLFPGTVLKHATGGGLERCDACVKSERLAQKIMEL